MAATLHNGPKKTHLPGQSWKLLIFLEGIRALIVVALAATLHVLTSWYFDLHNHNRPPNTYAEQVNIPPGKLFVLAWIRLGSLAALLGTLAWTVWTGAPLRDWFLPVLFPGVVFFVFTLVRHMPEDENASEWN